MFVIHRLITDRVRVDASGAEGQSNRGAGSFFGVANAARTEYLAFSHSSQSCNLSGGFRMHNEENCDTWGHKLDWRKIVC